MVHLLLRSGNYRNTLQCYLQIAMIKDIDSCYSYFQRATESQTLRCVQKYLIRQNELGFKQFREMYGDLMYAKVDSDEPAPEVQVMSSVRLPVTPVCFSLAAVL